ncbi:hypothetical protein FHR64_001759 [Xanthomonas arboricola]|uniref:Uncharacterized protein n=1 Tax=Xanthomonas euroxanthea TaxID=2259622 RepID=A0AA46C5Q1_9XANT|nr:hypothetical protein [Xanthomonas arboricola]SUZ26837.1 hypothetical protein CPBF424_05980 [Xanthomonas euroxanthea]
MPRQPRLKLPGIPMHAMQRYVNFIWVMTNMQSASTSCKSARG